MLLSQIVLVIVSSCCLSDFAAGPIRNGPMQGSGGSSDSVVRVAIFLAEYNPLSRRHVPVSQAEHGRCLSAMTDSRSYFIFLKSDRKARSKEAKPCLSRGEWRIRVHGQSGGEGNKKLLFAGIFDLCMAPLP
jgi:hypothetical protein